MIWFDWRLWLAVVIAVLGAAVAIQTGRLHTAEARLDAAQQRIGVLVGDIARQNAAVEALKAESDVRTKAAQKGLAKASTEAQAARTEAERLRAAAKAAGAQQAPTGSGADRAVATIRGAL